MRDRSCLQIKIEELMFILKITLYTLLCKSVRAKSSQGLNSICQMFLRDVNITFLTLHNISPKQQRWVFHVRSSCVLSFPQDVNAASDPAAGACAAAFNCAHTHTQSHPTLHSDHHPGPALPHCYHASAAAAKYSNPTLMMQR